MLPVALMDARNSQFLQRTATNSSGSLQLKSPVSLGAGDFGLYTWRRLVWRCLPWWVCSAGACLGGLPWERPAFALALLGLMGVLRLPWHLSAWRSCEVLACDSDLVRQGRGLPYKTESVKDLVRQTWFSRTNWIRKRISLAQ